MLNIFFFQAEDGIRDLTVTGVQTCALPIYWRPGRDAWGGPVVHPRRRVQSDPAWRPTLADPTHLWAAPGRHREPARGPAHRSEERRVGEEGRSRWSPYH